MRLITFILLFALSGKIYAQELVQIYEDSLGTKNFIRISSMNYYNSNRFSNDMMDKFIFGGTITDDIKIRVQDRLKTMNTMGAEFEQRIDSYTPEVNPFKREKYGLMISFSDNHFAAGNLSSDLFNTTFFGNAAFIGDTMDFSFSHLQYQHYQKFSIGFYDETTLSSIQISYVGGSRAFNMRLADSWMLSQSDLDTVQLTTRGTGHMTDNFYPYWAFQGNGFSIDLNYNFTFLNKKEERQVINLKINNLGAIFWNKNTHSYAVDSTVKYTGFDIQDFLSDDTTAFEDKYNFGDTLGIRESIGNFTEVLPMELVVQKLPDHNSAMKLQPIFGFKAILSSDYFPYLYGGVYYQPIRQFSMSTRLAYGGFGGFKWGLNLNYRFGETGAISIGTFDMIGNISSKYGFGRSVNVSAYFKM